MENLAEFFNLTNCNIINIVLWSYVGTNNSTDKRWMKRNCKSSSNQSKTARTHARLSISNTSRTAWRNITVHLWLWRDFVTFSVSADRCW